MSEWISSSFNDFGSVSTDSIASYSRTLRQKSQSGPDKSLPHVSHHSLGKALPRSRLRKQRTSGSHEDSTVCGQASSLKGTSGRLSSKGSLKADLWCDIYSPENVVGFFYVYFTLFLLYHFFSSVIFNRVGELTPDGLSGCSSPTLLS